MNIQNEQDLVSRISKDITKSAAPSRPSLQRIDEEKMRNNAAVKIQASFRRRKAMY